MNGQNPLDMLRDIHLPGEVSAWPPAPGWWILAILSIALILWIIRFFVKKHQQQRLLRLSVYTMNELEHAYSQHQDPAVLVKQYSSLLRQIALARFPRHEIASLTGQSWLTFLDDSAGTRLFNADNGKTDAGNLLTSGPYQKSETPIEHLNELKQAIHQWVTAVNTPRQQKQATEPSGGSQ